MEEKLLNKSSESSEINDVNDILKCPICLDKYTTPITLTCGETICKYHLEHSSFTKDKKFKCDICAKEHIFPDGGFPINKTIQKMLQIHLDRLDRGESFKNAKLSFDLLSAKYKSFELINQDPAFFIDEYFADLVNKIDIKREEVKLEIDNHYDKLLNYLKLTKNISQEMADTNKNILTNDLKYLKNEIDLFDKDLKMLDIDEIRWNNIESKTKILINKIDYNLKELKNYFLLDQSYEFICPLVRFDANFLGHLEIVHNDNILNFNDDIQRFNQSVQTKLVDGSLKKYKLVDYDEIKTWQDFSPDQQEKIKSKLKLLEKTIVTNIDQIEHTNFIKSIEYDTDTIKNYIIASPRELKTGDRYITILKELNPCFNHEFLTDLGFGVVIINGKFEQIN